MSPQLLLAVVAALLLAAVFAYTTIKWRRAPAAFKAMNYVAAISLIAGITIGSLATRALFGPTSSEQKRGAWPPHASQADSSPGSEPAEGIPAEDVAGALLVQSVKHLRDPKWQSWSSFAQDCRLGLVDSHFLRCEAARIEQDPSARSGEWKEHTS